MNKQAGFGFDSAFARVAVLGFVALVPTLGCGSEAMSGEGAVADPAVAAEETASVSEELREDAHAPEAASATCSR